MMLLGIYNIEIHIEDDFGIHKNILLYVYYCFDIGVEMMKYVHASDIVGE